MEDLLKIESVDFTYSVRKVYCEMSIKFDWALPHSFEYSTRDRGEASPFASRAQEGRTSRVRTSSSEPSMTGHDEKGRKVAENLL